MVPPRDATLVLVAEDDANALSGYLEFLSTAGFVAVGRSNGNDALALAVETVPDIIVTDIAMPGMDGFKLAEALRAHRPTCLVPVVGMTAHWNAEMQKEALKAGINAMIAKPCMPAHLLAEVERVLRHSRLMADLVSAEVPKPFGLRNAAMRRMP
jgi:DNA-binding response OmpR family regulator